jgi:hypothetical protein
MYNIENLQILLDESTIKFGQKKRFIHPKTVKNFLIHFHTFKDKKKKDHIYNNLSGYLEALSRWEFDDLTPKTSISLFDQYITPLVRYYNVYQGFSIHIKWPFLFFIVVVLLGIISLTNLGVYSKAGVVLTVGAFFIYSRIKEKLHKTYGVYY